VIAPHRHRALILLLGLALALPGLAQQEGDPPDLPPGLGEPEEPDNPPLPPGLGETDAEEEEPEQKKTLADRLPRGLHAFAEARVGPRIRNDPAHSESFTLAETRLQAEYDRMWSAVSLDTRGDLIFDAVLDEVDTDLRELRLSFRPTDRLDVQVGRQIMTWGTGDLLFINDLFPKDWQAFFIGRDEDYLKAPSDALRVGWFSGRVNLDLAYTPQFDHDRFIGGERISFWDPATGGFRGDAMPLSVQLPDDYFDDDETALRIYGNAGSYEIAGYAYTGFWKSPAGFDPVTTRATFPRLDVWGASVRGPLGPGIGNVEIGYYDSKDDSGGGDPFVNNSELRLLVGYELELARELTGGFQYYVERLLDYDRYRESLPGGAPRDQNRHVLTVRITKLLRGQTLIPSVFVYYSPSDEDGYLRPKLSWKRNDRWTIEVGANLFFGAKGYTFFGQFEDGSNVYGSVRFQL
jgi:hypothetical protein